MTWQIIPSDGFNQGRPMYLKDEEEVDEALPIIFSRFPNLHSVQVIDLSGEAETWYRVVKAAEFRR
jgi:hypothetical protein